MADQLLENPRKRAALQRHTVDGDHNVDADAPAAHPLIALGGQAGNAAVARMLAQRADMPEDEEQVQAKHEVSREGEEEDEIQAKHDVAREGEEDEEVMASHDLQRDDAPAPEVGLEGGPLSPELSGRIDAKRGAGQGLDDGTRASMEGAFGASFEDVRVHTDAEADSLNRSISARAFTTGSDIFFRRDASPGDHALLAHELTHVVQQRGSAGAGGAMTVGPAGDASEVAADSMSTAVTSGAAAQAQREADETAAQRSVAQREAAPDEEEPPTG